MSMKSSTIPSRVAPIERLDVAAFTIPTAGPEADGTLTWDSTTMVVVHLSAGDVIGLEYTYADASVAAIIDHVLSKVIVGRDVVDVESCYDAMLTAIRNLGRQGIVATAVAAVDIALWDAKARLLDVPLVSLLGGARAAVPVYG